MRDLRHSLALSRSDGAGGEEPGKMVLYHRTGKNRWNIR